MAERQEAGCRSAAERPPARAAGDGSSAAVAAAARAASACGFPSAAAMADRLDRVKRFIDPRLDAAVQHAPEAAPRLVEAMRYALLAPGKRLRPALVLWAASACDGGAEGGGNDPPRGWEAAAPAAVAVEMIHAYSLVHDDLPAMDDDDLRRGRPTCHRAFDEATAILCGDALQALAFETLAGGMPPRGVARACHVLARAAGPQALVGGQMDDLAAERGWIDDITTAAAAEREAWLARIHRRKTGALFLAALELGGLAVGASAGQLADLAAYGRGFGLAFQIADDILDEEGTEDAVGKRVGKDVGRGKLTFPSVVGVAESRRRAAALAAEARDAAGRLGPAADDLALLAGWIVHRDH
jgi:geranylgeranyl diphosphate synthase type II